MRCGGKFLAWRRDLMGMLGVLGTIREGEEMTLLFTG
jgi:hypothetical protein